MRAPFQFASAAGTVTGWADDAPGAAETVVLVHGANGHAGEWEQLASALAPTLRLIAVDLPAHGDSPAASVSLDSCREAVLAALDGLDAPRAHVVGSSFGGLVALSLAADHPDRVRTVTTVGTGTGGDVALAEAIADAIAEHGVREFYAESIPQFSYPEGTPAAVLDAAIARASAPEAEVAIQIVRAAFGTDARVIPAPLAVPLLVLGGQEDLTCPPERVGQLAAQFGTAPLIVPGLGHLPQLEHPVRLARLLSAFWELPVEPGRTVVDLAALGGMTRDARGVQRLCWGDGWRRARHWYEERLAEIPGIDVVRDAAGNLHATLPGVSERTVVVGSHLDSVSDGGNLDGAYGVLAGLEVLRAAAHRETPLPVTLRLTDWADEEGARFGRSLFGSAAVAGSLDVDALRALADAEGRSSTEVLAENGVDLGRIEGARAWMRGVSDYLELHIEQGPRLEAAGRPLAAVTGSLGVQRHAITLRGVPSHAGGTPMEVRADPVQSAARFLVAGRDLVRAAGGLLTAGVLTAHPGTPTAIAGTVGFTVDVRHEDAAALVSCWERLEGLLAEISEQEGVRVEREALWQIAPVPFDETLIARAADVVDVLAGIPERMVSGPLHDACEMAMAGIPTVMIFVPSVGGVSHAAAEHTETVHLWGGVRALAALLAVVCSAAEEDA